MSDRGTLKRATLREMRRAHPWIEEETWKALGRFTSKQLGVVGEVIYRAHLHYYGAGRDDGLAGFDNRKVRANKIPDDVIRKLTGQE